MFETDDGRVFGIYEDSSHDDIMMVCDADQDFVLAKPSLGFHGESVRRGGAEWILAKLDHEAAVRLRGLFKFTSPVRVLGEDKTMGVGDRLGIATDGQIRAFRKHPEIKPVFAQQSMRELNLTGRSFEDVVDSATFAVFRNNFTGGFGADGDHLKKAEEIERALACGCTMITLDCVNQINSAVESMTDEEVDRIYKPDEDLEKLYIGRTFALEDGIQIAFGPEDLKRAFLVYGQAINHIVEIYRICILDKDGRQRADFEISIDETSVPTKPAQHFFVASELSRRGVRFQTMAPRFCGEFQKGIDYIGNIEDFQADMRVHAAIARHFGYKISIHSGSDKFSIFPVAGRETRGRFHLKTAGTNWLEAARLVAMKDPGLYRGIHKHALSMFGEAQKFYHVTTDLGRIPDVDGLSDDELPKLLDNDDARQLIHITYGFILQSKDGNGNFLFRDRLFKVLRKNREDYARLLAAHTSKHMDLMLGR